MSSETDPRYRINMNAHFQTVQNLFTYMIYTIDKCPDKPDDIGRGTGYYD